MQLDRPKFNRLHETFLQHMLKESDVPFQAFDHPFLVQEEVSYKYEATRKGREALNLKQWSKWQGNTGRILNAVREACEPSNSANLLSAPRFGAQQGSSAALYRVDSREEIAGLESELFDFFAGGSPSPESFGLRFDQLSEYLRENRLGCNWRFLAYLAFLLQHQLYFPVLPTKFDQLLDYFEIPARLSGKVTWDRYIAILDLGQTLADELVQYGRPNAIEVQSYMYVAATLLNHLVGESKPTPFDSAAELQRRLDQAAERERIGLRGEVLVLEAEKEFLRAAGREDLANRVRLVSVDQGGCGYDLLSFTPAGDEVHLEIKATTRSRLSDHGFWISENERAQAELDPRWGIVRVWSVFSLPQIETLGNIVNKDSAEWRLNAATWFVEKLNSESSSENT